MELPDLMSEPERMRREIATFLDADLIAEMTRRGLLRTAAIEALMTPEAAVLGVGYSESVARQMAGDLGRFIANNGGTTITSSAERMVLAATVLVVPPSSPPSSASSSSRPAEPEGP